MAITLALIVLWITCGVFSGYVASQRGGNGVLWGCLGMLLGPFALIASFASGPETKICVACRKGIHLQASKCPYCQTPVLQPQAWPAAPPPPVKPISNAQKIFTQCMLAVVAVAITILVFRAATDSGTSGTEIKTIEGVLTSDALVASELDNLTLAAIRGQAGDTPAILGLLQKGKLNKLESGTEVVVVMEQAPFARIRVTSGAQVGERFWVNRNQIRVR